MTQQTGQTALRDPVDVAIGGVIRLLVHERDEGGLSAGDRAELRRMDPLGAALPPALWRLLTLPEVGTAIGFVASGDREPTERAFAIVVQAIAEAGASSGTPLGKALAETGYAEARFVRLLRARGLEDVGFEARQAARWCAVKGAAFQVARFSRFILDAALMRKGADRRAHVIARDYFAAPTVDAPGAAAMET
jgi:CRISPR system Cascade subunit CasB